MKKRLRAEIYDAYTAMGRSGLRVDPEVYELARMRLKDPALCGSYAKDAGPLPVEQQEPNQVRLAIYISRNPIAVHR